MLRSKWNPAFAWLPVESIIHDRQWEYYAAINASNDVGESTVFIEFMLSAAKASLIEVINTSDEMSEGKIDKAALRWNKIQTYLQTHDYIINADVRELWCIIGDGKPDSCWVGIGEKAYKIPDRWILEI